MANPNQSSPAPNEKTVTVVINNGSGMQLAQMPHRGTDSHKRILLGDSVRLLPGVNLVDTDVLTTLRKNPLFESKFVDKIPAHSADEYRHVRVGKPFLVAGKTLSVSNPLGALPEKEAIELINDADEELLARFKERETRAEVRLAIMNRVELLNTTNNTSEDF